MNWWWALHQKYIRIRLIQPRSANVIGNKLTRHLCIYTKLKESMLATAKVNIHVQHSVVRYSRPCIAWTNTKMAGNDLSYDPNAKREREHFNRGAPFDSGSRTDAANLQHSRFVSRTTMQIPLIANFTRFEFDAIPCERIHSRFRAHVPLCVLSVPY